MAVKKRILLIAVFAVAAAVLLAPGVAFANYSIHGSYTMSTDACAGCHRAHTAASSITWTRTDGSTGGSALLLGTSTSIDDFCYTCHGTAMLGADTNVFDGIYEADDGVGLDDTLNSAGQSLNGGGFDPAMFPTQHYPNNTGWVAYGGGTTGRAADGIRVIGGTEDVVIGCTVCHDVHGSSNYRLLKDVVNGVTVGGYNGSVDPYNPVATPWVISAEPGYPTSGWLLHEPGATQVSAYRPDYTDERYAKAPNGDPTKGISGWCASCHTQYNTWASSTTTRTSSVYDSNDGFGLVTRHRHPVNVPLSNYLGARALVVTDTTLPLAHDGAADYAATPRNTSSDWIDCLTCHVGHGSSALMTGYAAVADSTDPLPDSSYGLTPGDGLGSVPPGDGNALLRGNNRFVCEACHNK
jgi:predicted CXXCH cytochrome family protein